MRRAGDKSESDISLSDDSDEENNLKNEPTKKGHSKPGAKNVEFIYYLFIIYLFNFNNILLINHYLFIYPSMMIIWMNLWVKHQKMEDQIFVDSLWI